MVSTAFRPRSVTEIVDAAFQILRAHYGQFVVCAALAYVPLLVLRLAVIGDPRRLLNAGIESPAQLSELLWITMGSSLAAWLTFTLMDSVLVVCASQAYLGDPVDAGIAVRRAIACAPRVIAAGAIWFVLVCLGFLALLVGAIYVAARCFAVTPAIVLENAGVGAAFSRSSDLSLGRKRHILNTLGLVVLIYWIVTIGVSTAGALFNNFVLSTVVTSLVTVLVYPVVAITEALLYYDSRIRSEGLDIELMARDLGIEDAPAPASR